MDMFKDALTLERTKAGTENTVNRTVLLLWCQMSSLISLLINKSQDNKIKAMLPWCSTFS